MIDDYKLGGCTKEIFNTINTHLNRNEAVPAGIAITIGIPVGLTADLCITPFYILGKTAQTLKNIDQAMNNKEPEPSIKIGCSEFGLPTIRDKSDFDSFPAQLDCVWCDETFTVKTTDDGSLYAAERKQ